MPRTPSTRRSFAGLLWASHSPCMVDWRRPTRSSRACHATKIPSSGGPVCTPSPWRIAVLATTPPSAAYSMWQSAMSTMMFVASLCLHLASCYSAPQSSVQVSCLSSPRAITHMSDTELLSLSVLHAQGPG